MNWSVPKMNIDFPIFETYDFPPCNSCNFPAINNTLIDEK